MRDFIKKYYYLFHKPEFPVNIKMKLGYVFHTEEIFDQKIFQELIRFCKEYISITGKKCISVTMTPPNQRVEMGMKIFGCSNGEYVNRMQELAHYAHIGFHGHFWHDPQKFEDASYDIKKHNTQYQFEILYRQFESQINWFKENNIPTNATYSGGWWFINRDIIELLLKHGIQYDYSMSMSPNLWNPYSIDLVQRNNIRFGESFYTRIEQKKLLHIQNLHCGAEGMVFPEDATRFLNRLIDPEFINLSGVLNSHDYCLDFDNTIKWIRYLILKKQVQFLDHQELIATNISNAKVIELL